LQSLDSAVPGLSGHSSKHPAGALQARQSGGMGPLWAECFLQAHAKVSSDVFVLVTCVHWPQWLTIPRDLTLSEHCSLTVVPDPAETLFLYLQMVTRLRARHGFYESLWPSSRTQNRLLLHKTPCGGM
jgi:hypothetical protein